MSLGENIYKLRTGKKLSQEDFASAMEVSRQSVSKWENDMAVPELEKLIKMAKLFEVSLDELVGNAPPLPCPEPKQESVPAPAQGITTGDIISIVLLLLTVIILPATFILDGSLFALALLIISPLFTWIASFCSPTNPTLFKVYGIFNAILMIFAAMLCAPLPLLPALPYIGVMVHWLLKLK